ncbi:MAG: M28 family peptidase [Atopobiaceae bacterium]|nr:M28 family peptidase [Atopobiaceae bacterium]
MAKTRDYMDYLDEKIEIAPANSQEEYQAAEAIAGIMDDHGLEPTIEEFEAHPLGRLMPHILAVMLLICVIVCGVTQGAVHIVFLLLSIAIVGLLIFVHYGVNVFETFGPSAKSQNVVAVHRASGDKVVKGSRPIVIVAHYDTPRESLLWRPPFVGFQSLLMRIKTPCLMAVAVTLFVQVLVFLPELVRTFFWIVGILAALPPLALAILTIIGNSGSCTYGSNDNKSSVAALLSVMDIVRPAKDRASGDRASRVARRRADDTPAAPPVPKRHEVVEEVKGVRHGKAVLSSLGILPPSCEIVYEEPKVRIVEEPVVEPERFDESDEQDAQQVETVEYQDRVTPTDDVSGDDYYDEEDYDEEFEEDSDEESSYDEDEEDYDEDSSYDEDEEDYDEDSSYDEDEEDYDEDSSYDEDESFDEDYEDDGNAEEQDDDEFESEEDETPEDDADADVEEAWYEDDESEYEGDYEDEEYEDDSYERSSIGSWFSNLSERIRSFFNRKRDKDASYEDEWEEDEAYEDEENSDEWVDEEDVDDESLVEDEDQQDDAQEYDDQEFDEQELDDQEEEIVVEDEMLEYNDDVTEREEVDQNAHEMESLEEEIELEEQDEPVWEESEQDEWLSWDEGDELDFVELGDEPDVQAEESDELSPVQYDDEYDDEYDELIEEEPVDFESDEGFEEYGNAQAEDSAPVTPATRGSFEYLDLDAIDGEIVGYEEYEEIVYVEDEEEIYEDEVEVVYEDEESEEPLAEDDSYEELEDEESLTSEEGDWQQEPSYVDEFDEYDDQDTYYEDEYDSQDETIEEDDTQIDDVDEYVDESVMVESDPYSYADDEPAAPSLTQKIRGAFRKMRSSDGTGTFVSDVEEEFDEKQEEDLPEEFDSQQEDYIEESDEELYQDEELQEEYDDEDDDWYEGEDYDEEGVYDDDEETFVEEHETPYEDEEAYEPPVDPNLLHFDREEDHDIVPRDTSGLDTYAEGYDVLAASPRRDTQREEPQPIDDPSWGTSTYQPPRPVMNIARRAALYDLPDPSHASIDPFDDEYGYDNADEGARSQNANDDSSRFWGDSNGASSSWKGGATMRADLRDSDEPIVIDEQDLQEAILELGDDFLVSHDIWFVATGASELDHAGIKAFMTEHKRDIRGSFLINLEAIGAGALSVITKEGLRLPRNADRRLVRMLATIAQDLHIGLDTALFDWDETDAASAMRSRVRSVTIAGLDDNNLPMYSHTSDDIPENVNPKQVSSVVRLVTELIRRS